MDFDLGAFYRERDTIMNQPDEDLNEYRKRMVSRLKSHPTQVESSMNLASFPGGSTLSSAEDGTNNCTAAMLLPSESTTSEISSRSMELHRTKLSEISSASSSRLKKTTPLRGSGSPSLHDTPTSRVQEHLGSHLAGPGPGHLIIDLIDACTVTKHTDQVTSSPKLVENENVEKMPQLIHRRNEDLGVKRKVSPIELTSPAKRLKGDQGEPIWNDISIRQTSTPLPLARTETPSVIKSFDPPRSIGTEDTKGLSEISSFNSQPRHSLQEQLSPARSSPISSFSHILTRSPSSGLRQQQNGPKPSSSLKRPYGHLMNKAMLPKEGKGEAHIRHGQPSHDDPPTSPIEDPSIQEMPELEPPAAIEKHKKGVIASGSSKLCLEVKERVARHVAMKQRDKVLPLRPQSVESLSPSRRRVREILNPEEASAERAPSVVKPRVTSSSNPSKSERPKEPKISSRNRPQLAVQKSKTKKKEKQRPITPAEYVQELLEKAAADTKPKKSSTLFLEGKCIFYIGGDRQFAGERTRGRMDLIMKHGGRLVPTFDPDTVTHIVTDANRQPTLRTLNYQHLNSIPGHIPTVKWSWVQSGISRLSRLDKEDIKVKMEDLWLHAAFSERMDTTTGRSKPNISTSNRNRSTVAESSVTPNCEPTTNEARSEQSSSRMVSSSSLVQEGHAHNFGTSSHTFSVDKGKQRESLTSQGGNTAQLTSDPLEEFYAEAREEREIRWSQFAECDDSDSEFTPGVGENLPVPSFPKEKKGWTCDKKENQQEPCPNQDIIEKLQELQELHKAKPGEEDHWRVFSYNKSIRAIRGYPKRIKSYTEARNIRGVGDKTALKIMEILSTGDLRRINYEKTDDIEVTRLYQGIYGVGQSTAFKWYSAGCRTLEDLQNQKGGVRLNPVQLLGLQYYDDINDRMPRDEAKAIFDLIKPLALSIDSKLFVEIMGSYRRGKNDCGDIDILITRPTDDERTHSGILARLLPMLRKEGIITEDLAIPDDIADLENVYRGLCRLPQAGSRRRRIDFLTVPWESRGAALLYYTGDDIFNRAMRLKARKMGYSLNQRGLFGGVVRDPKDSRIKYDEGMIVASDTEQEIFRILNVPWQEPHERVRG